MIIKNKQNIGENMENIKLENSFINAEFNSDNGLINRLFFNSFGNFNLADKNGFGGIRYTLKDDDIKTDKTFTLYTDKFSSYSNVLVNGNTVKCENTELSLHTSFSLENDMLTVHSYSENKSISQFGIDLNFNFLGKKNGTYKGQLIPSSPYNSANEDRMYYILPVVDVGFCTVVSMTPKSLWKLDYSPYSAGHFISGLQIMSSSDKMFKRESAKDLTLKIFFADTVFECYERIQKIFDCPMVIPNITGSFGDTLTVDILGNCDTVKVISDSAETYLPVKDGKAVINKSEYGKYTIVPYFNKKSGLDAQIWFGEDIKTLFKKSCDTVKKPYHGDDNLCEGMCWCWAMLSYMNFYKNTDYIDTVRDALKIIMCESDELVPRQSILPYEKDGKPAYHIYKSDRVQEQFFGISMLTEMYKLTQEQKYIDYAVNSAKAMIEAYQREDGAIVPKTDYTTVCAPIIPIVDLAVIFKDSNSELYNYFASAASKIAKFLVNRGLHFPTEGEISEINDEEMEEGSISCTALSILYYCRYIENKPEYIEFSKQVLALHDNWISYTPDVKLYRSTMRWWENIWEGDATGPAICGGHAWTIWRAEADYHMAVLTGNEDFYKKSLNGFMTNLSKIRADGETYACYQPDYFAGGGHYGIRSSLKTMSEEDLPKKYEITHDYPKHFDRSLSRYVWARFTATWLKDNKI